MTIHWPTVGPVGFHGGAFRWRIVQRLSCHTSHKKPKKERKKERKKEKKEHRLSGPVTIFHVAAEYLQHSSNSVVVSSPNIDARGLSTCDVITHPHTDTPRHTLTHPEPRWIGQKAAVLRGLSRGGVTSRGIRRKPSCQRP